MPLTDDRLSVGSIIFEFVYDTTPPKQKYYIIVGITEDKVALGTVFINSNVNAFFRSKPELLQLQIPISAADYPFLKWDSYINCTDIQERLIADVAACINSTDAKYGYCATISPQELESIRKALDSSRIMTPIKKRKFGIRK